jgi:riboflavin-specific deaminase-like protein
MVNLSNSATHNPLSDSELDGHEQAWPAAIFDPLRQSDREKMFVIGQIGQTIDGRIATVTGQSKYINGPSGLLHLHRLRAVVDAVVVGIGTVIADDPQLTVRLAKGAHPARVVIDPNHRLTFNPKIFNEDGARRVVITKLGADYPAPPGVEIFYLPAENGNLSPDAILQSLASAGLKRILIEGGADTVSRFMQAGCLDRLHVIVAPIIMGSGRPGFCLPAIDHMDQAQRLVVHSHKLDDELLFDCDLSVCTQRKKD